MMLKGKGMEKGMFLAMFDPGQCLKELIFFQCKPFKNSQKD